MAVAQEAQDGIPNVAGWWLSHAAARPPLPYPGGAGRCRGHHEVLRSLHSPEIRTQDIGERGLPSVDHLLSACQVCNLMELQTPKDLECWVPGC